MTAKAKPPSEWTRKELLALPYSASWTNEDAPLLSALILLPTRRRHDSGYLVIEVVGVDQGGEVWPFKLTGCSDVVNFDGIGGLGYRWTERNSGVPRSVPTAGWSIDLMRNGLFRIFRDGPIKVDCALSNFQFYAMPKEIKP